MTIIDIFARAFKHFKRSDFTNKNLIKNTVNLLVDIGYGWLWMNDTNLSDQRLTMTYLLQEMCSDYDKLPAENKRELDMATHTGFHGSIFILDQTKQLDLHTMEWLESDSLGKSYNQTNLLDTLKKIVE